MPEEPIKPVGKLTKVNPDEINQTTDIKPVGKLTLVGKAPKESITTFTGIPDEMLAQNKDEKINSMVDRLPEMPGDSQSKKQMIKDLIANGGKPEEVTQTIETLRGAHPKQKGGTKYYVDERGVAHPLANYEKPPEGYHVASVFGSVSDAKDDNVITDLAKTAWNIFPSVAGNVAGLLNTGAQLVTGEKSENLTSLQNASEALKFEKDPDIQGNLLKTENIKSYSDLLKGENWDLSPKTVWGNALSLAQSVGEFMLPASFAGKMIKGANWATEVVNGQKVLTTAGKVATLGAASYLTNHKEVADAADNAGLTGREAALFKTLVTAPIAAIDVKLGIGSKIFLNSAEKAEKDAFVASMAKKVLSKTESGALTQEALDDAVKETVTSYPKLAGTWLKETAGDANAQGIEELGQSAIQRASEQIWDNITPEEKAKFGTKTFSPESIADYINSYATGAIGAGPTALAFNKVKQIQKENDQSKTVFGVVQKGDEAIKNFKNNVFAAKESGELTDDEAKDAITRVNAYKEYNDIIGSLDLAEEKKRESFDLTFQKQNLESQLEAMGDPKKLNPLEQAQYAGIEKQANDIQKRITEIVTEAQVKKENVVAEKTAKDIEKQNEEPKPKEGEKKTKLSPVMQAMVDKYKAVSKPKDTRTFEQVPTDEFNENKISYRDKHEMVANYLEAQPNKSVEGKIAERTFEYGSKKDKVFGVELPGGKIMRFGSSMKRDEGFRGHFREEQFQGLTDKDLKGLPIGVKVVDVPSFEEGKPPKKAIKAYNTKTGKFVGWLKATNTGTKKEFTDEQIEGEGGLKDLEMVIEPTEGTETTPTEPTQPTEPTPEEKYAAEVASTEKPSVKMGFVSGKELAGAEKPLDAKRKHDKIKEDFKNLKQLIDCIWS